MPLTKKKITRPSKKKPVSKASKATPKRGIKKAVSEKSATKKSATKKTRRSVKKTVTKKVPRKDSVKRVVSAPIKKKKSPSRKTSPKVKPEIVRENRTAKESDPTGLKLAYQAAELMFEKKAEFVTIADLSGLSAVTDYFVICTAGSDIQARAIGDHVEDSLLKIGERAHHKEGFESARWLLLDYIDVIVHVFQKEAREFYDLERLWGDAKWIHLTDK